MSKPVNDADLDRIVTESGGVWVLRDSSDDGSVTVADLIAALREARAEVAFHMDGYEVIVQALIDHGGFPEVDGDGDEAGIIADHVRGLALERDAFQAAANERDQLIDTAKRLTNQRDDLRSLLADAAGVVRAAAAKCRSTGFMDHVADDLDALADRLAAKETDDAP